MEKYIENPESLFVVKKALAMDYKTEEGISSSLLCFNEDMCFDETPQRYPGPFLDRMLIDGPAHSFVVCQITKRTPIMQK